MKLFHLHPYFKPAVKKPWLRFFLEHLLAILLPITGMLLTILVGPPISSTPLLIFIPIIAICAWRGGFTAGILCSIVSAIMLNYYSLTLDNPKDIYSYTSMLQFFLIIIEGICLSFIIEAGKRQERITAYKKAETELKKTVEKLQEQSAIFQKEIRQRDEFLSIASHELKTPLTSMLLQTQTALHNIRNVSVAHFSFEHLLNMLESVENQTKRLSKMINDLLAVSIITAGNLNLEYEEIDLGKLVKGVITDFQARIDKEKYKINFQTDEKVIGNWDKIRIEQAISNFISNAIKYGDHKPIEIKVRKVKKYAEFIIADNGIGISGQKQKKIFELFQRAVSPEEYKGLGVGLYITQKIVNAHAGSVEVASRQGNGAKFTMKIPLRRPEIKPE